MEMSKRAQAFTRPVRDLQQKLRSLGFYRDAVDGVYGRGTMTALMAFQNKAAERGVKCRRDGILDPMTIRALELWRGQAIPPEIYAPWLMIVLAKVDLHEVRHNGWLRKFLSSDGRTLGDPAKLPWCGDLVETAIALTLPGEQLPANPYGAKNWARFGAAAHSIGVGSVLVFHRGDPKDWRGHVGFYFGEDRDHYYVAGGNQSNSVTPDAKIRKDRLMAARMPGSVPVVALQRMMSSTGPLSVNEA